MHLDRLARERSPFSSVIWRRSNTKGKEKGECCQSEKRKHWTGEAHPSTGENETPPMVQTFQQHPQEQTLSHFTMQIRVGQ